jgi:REP element-mobilizing transposase RayT
MRLNAPGAMVAEHWLALPARFPLLRLDAYVIMPDHLHAVLSLDAAGAPQNPTRMSPRGTATGTLGRVIQAFKSLTTTAYIVGVREAGWPPFEQRLWHRNYYEHVVRDQTDLDRIRTYIVTNPSR